MKVKIIEQKKVRDNVTKLTLEDDRELYIIGTAHVSEESVRDVEEIIADVKPDAVAVELCEKRHERITNPGILKDLDLIKMIRERKFPVLSAHIIISIQQIEMAKKLGVKAGAEFIKAIKLAKENNAQLILADRDPSITMQRIIKKMGLCEIIKTFFYSFYFLFIYLLQLFFPRLQINASLESEEVEEMKGGADKAISPIGKHFPNLKKVIIDERNLYIAYKIMSSLGRKTVVVMGAGHVTGVIESLKNGVTEKEFKETNNLSKLDWKLKLAPWTIVAVMLSFFAYGFYYKDFSLGDMALSWVLINSGLSSLLTLFAGCSPFAALATAIFAPFTGLYPGVHAGIVAAIVQAYLRRATMHDVDEVLKRPPEFNWRKNNFSKVMLAYFAPPIGSLISKIVFSLWLFLS